MRQSQIAKVFPERIISDVADIDRLARESCRSARADAVSDRYAMNGRVVSGRKTRRCTFEKMLSVFRYEKNGAKHFAVGRFFGEEDDIAKDMLQITARGHARKQIPLAFKERRRANGAGII